MKKTKRITLTYHRRKHKLKFPFVWWRLDHLVSSDGFSILIDSLKSNFVAQRKNSQNLIEIHKSMLIAHRKLIYSIAVHHFFFPSFQKVYIRFNTLWAPIFFFLILFYCQKCIFSWLNSLSLPTLHEHLLHFIVVKWTETIHGYFHVEHILDLGHDLIHFFTHIFTLLSCTRVCR